MPRQPRLDAPGVLHHVMVRGIERRTIFRDDTDRAAFVDRRAGWSLEAIIQRLCTNLGMDSARLHRGARKPLVSLAREGIAYSAVEVVGHSGRALAPRLGLRPVSVSAAARRGLADRQRWDALLSRK